MIRIFGRRAFLGGTTAVALALAAGPASACLWDYDTVQQERSRFPDALELITGKFLRHSPEFYRWRIEDRLRKLQSDPNNLAWRDDLAVAYQKVGRTTEAIEALETKDAIRPGLYETESNLGTVLILSGDLAGGLPHIEKALAINPDAHFGREKYQKWLVEYALSRSADGKLPFPLRNFKTHEGERYPDSQSGFDEYLAAKWKSDPTAKGNREEALKGVLGMMRFADHDNPLLLEALGDLLAADHQERDAQQLAARAYLKASQKMTDARAKAEYRLLAANALATQVLAGGEPSDDGKLETVEAALAREQADADAWYAELRRRELAWIAEGGDVDAKFDALYPVEPTALQTEISAATRGDRAKTNAAAWRWAGLAATIAALAGGIGWARRRRADA